MVLYLFGQYLDLCVIQVVIGFHALNLANQFLGACMLHLGFVE